MKLVLRCACHMTVPTFRNCTVVFLYCLRKRKGFIFRKYYNTVKSMSKHIELSNLLLLSWQYTRLMGCIILILHSFNSSIIPCKILYLKMGKNRIIQVFLRRQVGFQFGKTMGIVSRFSLSKSSTAEQFNIFVKRCLVLLKDVFVKRVGFDIVLSMVIT